MMGANNRMDEISKQFDTLYKDAIDNLRFLKTQEWSATNYTLVLQGAIFALIDRAGPNMRSFLVVALIVIPAIAVLVILQAETSMAKFRTVSTTSINITLMRASERHEGSKRNLIIYFRYCFLAFVFLCQV